MTTIHCEIVQILINCGCSQHALKFAGLTAEKFFAYKRDDLTCMFIAEDGGEKLVQKIMDEIQKSKVGKDAASLQNENADFQILKNKGTPTIVEVEIIDDDEAGPMEEVNGGGPSLKRQREEESSDEDESMFLNSMNGPENCTILRNRTYAKLHMNDDHRVYTCDKGHPNQTTLKNWTEKVGSQLWSLKVSTWTWTQVTSPCPWNLLKILTHQCPTIRELSIEANISTHSDDDQEVPHFPANFRLSKLKILRIHHDGEMDYDKQLEQILLAADKLREIYFSYGTLEAANSFLTLLRNLEGYQLQNLKVLSVKSFHGAGYLKELQMVKLAKVAASSLEKLILGHGLWEDVEGPTFEEVLYRFKSSLKSLQLIGCFHGNGENREITSIKFPPMTNLESIEFGTNYTYDTIYEDRLHSATKIKNDTNWTVILQFPLLPNLRALRLGNLFVIKHLHFATFPKLEIFFVSSRWDLSVVFPLQKTSRRASYPLVTCLRLPDLLDDPSFIQLIPGRFPNLKFCGICLPTVNVLRTFFNSMRDSDLERLILETRFDLASTLDTCLLDKALDVVPRQDDVKKIRMLKEYGHWEEFVRFHRIELPPYNLLGLDEGGLSSLKKLRRLTLCHRPRILKIPIGHLHWTDPNCQFTDQFIGFHAYPWPKSCEDLINNLMEKTLQNNHHSNYYIPFRARNKPKLLTFPFTVRPCSSGDGLDELKDEEQQNLQLPRSS